ncbi:MAG TPA: TraB/GumN family protein [Caulobacteraceae bacterium]|nr:TraB/GumN family protein [Caulobacteraceae bacterium]
MNLKTLLTRGCVATAVAIALVFGGQANAEPAMWVIKDADSTIYLFGSVHLLKPGLDWQSPKLTAAVKSAQEIWFEIPNPSDQEKLVAEVLPSLMQKGLSPDKPLSSRLNTEDFAKITDRAKAIGLDPRALDVMRPWLAAMILSAAPIKTSGYEPSSGVEVTLERQAKAAGEEVRAFETVQQQLAFFADLPEEVQLAYLKSVLDDKNVDGDVDKLVDAWMKADLTALEKGAVGEAKAQSPALYEALIAGRNKAWADRIAERLKGSGVSFIAVGAGHLVGPDSLQAQLKKRGIEVSRY